MSYHFFAVFKFFLKMQISTYLKLKTKNFLIESKDDLTNSFGENCCAKWI